MKPVPTLPDVGQATRTGDPEQERPEVALEMALARLPSPPITTDWVRKFFTFTQLGSRRPGR